MPRLSKSGVMYKVKCSCCNASSVGESKGRLHGSRLKEYQRGVQKGKVGAPACMEFGPSCQLGFYSSCERQLSTLLMTEETYM